jgi:hypothetical protein
MKIKLFLIIAVLTMCYPSSIMQAQESPSATTAQPTEKTQTESGVNKESPAAEKSVTPATQTLQEQKAAPAVQAGQEQQTAPVTPKDEVVKKDIGGAAVYFNVASLNLFDYGIGFVFGFDPMLYGFSGMLGYRHLNTFKGFPGIEGGTVAALDIFIDAGATIASIDGGSVVAGFGALTIASNILWFKSLANGNNDRTGNGIFIGAKIEASYSKLGFRAGYGPAIGWTMVYYNTEKKRFRTTNISVFFYPPTMTLGVNATTSF